MQRTLITEQADGTFQCVVTLTAEELPEFLGKTRAPKPEPIRVQAGGFEAGAVQPEIGVLPDPVQTLLAHNRFLNFAATLFGPVPDDEEVRDFIARKVAQNGEAAWERLVGQYQSWHEREFVGQNPFPE